MIRLERGNYSLVRGLQDGCYINKHENNINLNMYPRQGPEGTRCVVEERGHRQSVTTAFPMA